VYDAINLGRRIDVVWPDEKMRIRGGRSHWKDWLPEKGMEGLVLIARNDMVLYRFSIFFFLISGGTPVGSKSP
jgi:hypothetical protein